MKIFLIILGAIAVIALGYFGYRFLYKNKPVAAPTVATPNQIAMENFAFTPNNISVAVGQKVTFINNDFTTHNIVANDGTFTSGNIAPGKRFEKTFATAGIIAYHCSIHPSMTGQIEIK